MGSPKSPSSADRANVGRTAADLAALGTMTGAQLAAKFEELFERPATTRNKQYLRKRIAWEIQARIEGNLSERALQRIEDLAAHVPDRWKQALDSKAPARPVPARLPVPPPGVRDPRLPSPGTVLTRPYGGVEHRVTVLADGFEYRGEQYGSLSAIARKITGTAWNGFQFFLGRSKGKR